MSKRKMNFDTKVIHAGQPHPRIEGAVNVPIFQSSTFEYKGQKIRPAILFLFEKNVFQPY